MRSRLQLDTEVFPLIKNKNRDEIVKLLLQRYRKSSFEKLTNDQLENFINFLKESNGTTSLSTGSDR
jgi:hypothetical protein